jgi:DNA-binding transcriptional regulator YdaS (Cro superfamily)
MTPFEALKIATKRAKSQSALARICGCSQTAVWKMFQAKRMSTQYVLLVEAATGVSRHDLRPDIYPRPITQPVNTKRRAADRHVDAEGLGPWDTGVYDNQPEIFDYTQGATL